MKKCKQKCFTLKKQKNLPLLIRCSIIKKNSTALLSTITRTLTFYLQPANHLGIAVAIPHLTHIRPCVTGLGSLYEQACHTLFEARVCLQRAVVLQPAVFGYRVTRGLARELHSMRCHHLTALKAIQDVGCRIGRICVGSKRVKCSTRS